MTRWLRELPPLSRERERQLFRKASWPVAIAWGTALGGALLFATSGGHPTAEAASLVLLVPLVALLVCLRLGRTTNFLERGFSCLALLGLSIACFNIVSNGGSVLAPLAAQGFALVGAFALDYLLRTRLPPR